MTTNDSNRSFLLPKPFWWAGLMLGALSFSLMAAAPPVQVRIRPAGIDPEGSPVFELNWNASAGGTYRIQARDGLEVGRGWETIDVVTPEGAEGRFKVSPDKMEAGAEGIRRRFLRLVAPEPAIHKVEPSVGPTSGGTFYLAGQCLNPTGQLRVGSLVLAPNVLQPGKLYSFDLAQMAPGTYDVEWLEAGQAVARKPQLLTIAGGPLPFLQRWQEPPDDPPGAAHFKEVTGLDVYIDCIEVQEGGKNDGAHKRPGPRWQPSSGELMLTEVDLEIPGQGLDFVWARTYRSRESFLAGYTDHFRTMGHRWDHSYNIFVQEAGSGIAVHDGTGRRDVYSPGTNGVYTCPEFFNEVTVSGKGLKLTFPWRGFWEFHPLDGTAAAGKIARSVDRNGNQLTFQYDATGRLSEIVDSLKRTIRVDYTPDGLVQSVTDFTGRSVTYSYYRQGQPDGGPGDLATVTSPIVVNTPTKNDFPQGKTTRYRYSTGFTDERQNHLLVSITDPKGQTPYRFEYQHNQTDLDFLRVRSFQRGTQHHAFVYSYIPQGPTPQNGYAVLKTIVNDPNGNVQEMWFNSRNQKIVHRDLAARSVPGQPVTETQNRPTTKVRESDPDYWETRYDWNLDSLLTRLELPKGNSQEFVYENDFHPPASAFDKGNLRVTRNCCADLDRDGLPDVAVSRYSYDPRFGSPGRGRSIPENSRSGPRQSTPMDGPFITKAVDARGYVQTFTYDDRGNLTKHTPPLVPGNETPEAASTLYSHNEFGQTTSITHPANHSGVKRVDTFTYYKDGEQRGYLYEHVADATGFQASTRFVYDAVGNVTEQTDPRGFTRKFHNNQLNQLVLYVTAPICENCGPEPSRPTRAFYYDANDNLVRVEQSNEDETGKSVAANPSWTSFAEYDDLNRTRLMAHELTHVVQQGGGGQVRSNQFVYDGLDNVILHQLPEAVSGADSNNVIQYEFDTRNLLHRKTRAPGTALRSGEEYDYDGNGNVARYNSDPYVETAQRPITSYTYDGLERQVQVVDPMGNIETLRYDAAGNLVGHRSDGETNDVAGSAGNIRLSETLYEYDGRGRCVRNRELFFNPVTGQAISDGQAVTSFAYAPNGQLTAETDDNGHTTRYAYDTLHRLSSMTDAKSNVVVYAYDLNDNILSTTETSKSDLGTDQTFSLQFTYDPLNRLSSRTDNVGNTERYAYDSRGNRVSVVNESGNETRFAYDGLNRVVDTLPYQGSATAGITINTSHVEYQNDRCVSVTDQHGNTTTYFHDPLDRVYRTRSPDGTMNTVQFDRRNNVVRTTDAKGTEVVLVYDLNDRCIRKDITPGPLVSPQTTFELFTYDGLSRLVHATNNVSMVEFSYDSLDHIEKMKQDCIAAYATHDGLGNTLSLTYHGGSVVSYVRDSLNRVTGVSFSPNAATRPVSLGTYGYEGGERLGRIARPNALNTRVMWNGVAGTPNSAGDLGWKQVRSVRHARAGGGQTLDERTLAYDASQNKVERTLAAPFVPGGSIVSARFAYDALHRLTRGTHLRDGAVESDNNYGLNALGMRTNVTRLSGMEIYTMDPTLPEPADFQMSQYTTSPLGSHVYDENGNLVMLNTSGPGTIFHYDYANRLVHVDRTVGPGLVPLASFTYDPLGRRISRTVYPSPPSAPLTTQFLYGPDEDCDGYLEERIDGVTQKTIVYPQGPEVAGVILVQNGQPTYQLCDDLGNVVALASAAGEIIERYEYDDFGYPQFLGLDGQPLVDAQGLPVTQSPAGNPFLFHGNYWDSELELYFAKGWPCRYEGPRFDSSLTRIHGDPHVDEKDGTRWDFTRRGNGFGNPWSQRNPQVGAPKKSFASKLGGFAKGVASVKKEEGGRHTPFHNKYRPSYRTGFSVLLDGPGGDDCDDKDELIVGGGDCDDTDDSASISALYFEHKVLTAREAGSGMATGRRQYQPLLIRKRIDKASPLLSKTVITGREAGSGMATGRRQYQPLLIRKRIDKGVALYKQAVITAREAGSGMATGRRQYQPLLIRKRIDKASPLLMRSAAFPGDNTPIIRGSALGGLRIREGGRTVGAGVVVEILD